MKRHVPLKQGSQVEYVGFCDASEQAFAPVVYLRCKSLNEGYHVSLLMSKSKVAPVKQDSVPKLELCSAVLLAQLIARCQRVLKLTEATIHCWSDSTVTLGWLRGHPNRWITYVANRVSDVQRLVPEANWHRVPGQDNPADCASRGIAPAELVNHPLWWQGPSFLKEEELPISPQEFIEEDLPEEKKRLVCAATVQQNEENPMLVRFSCYRRLLRITAWCRRWIASWRQILQTEGTQRSLTAREIEEAELCWVRQVQAATYASELQSLRKGAAVKTNSSLSPLTPFVNKQGVLRVGSRLKHSTLKYEQIHLTILPPSSLLSELLVLEHHQRTLNGGTQLTLGSVRQRFWIPQGRRLIKSVINKCVTSLRWRAETSPVLMGDLPAARVTAARPFQRTGVDYAGPYHLRTAPGRGHKSYKGFLVVFVCLSTKAEHLDVTSSYSTDAFLSAFKRFVSRRGLCTKHFSDQGTNFDGADAELTRMFNGASQEFQSIQDHLSTLRVKWTFNPSGVPHFGGLWEAAVKSIKHHLRRCLGENTLTFEEMRTLLAQVEACLNSRPLCALSDDPDDLQALTPGHFLVDGPLNVVPDASLLGRNVNRLARWQLITNIRDYFWKRSTFCVAARQNYTHPSRKEWARKSSDRQNRH